MIALRPANHNGNTDRHEEEECDWEQEEERSRRKGVLLKRTKTPIGTRKRNVTGKRKKRG